MVDPLVELQVILGVFFWLGFHQLVGHVWRNHYLQCGHPRRSQKAKYPPLPGLLEKPHCAHCAADSTSSAVPVPEPPPLMSSRRGRPRRVKTSGHYCPKLGCRYYGWLNRGNIRANGHPNGRGWRQLHCLACGGYFLETHGTLFYGKQQAPETILYAICCLAEGVGLRATARIFAVDAKTVLSWLIAAAEHRTAVSTYLLHELNVTQIQLDELFALVAEWRTQPPTETEAAEALARLPRRPRWVWTATDPISKLWFHWTVGERSLAQAQTVIHQIMHCLATGSAPLFLSDGLNYYRIAILTHFGHWWQPPRRSPYGSVPKPRWCPLPALQYAQVVKKCRRRRLVKLIQRVVFGCQETIQQTLHGYGWHINTAFVERLNLTLRQHVCALARRTCHLAKTQAGLERSLALFQAYYNVCLPHASLSSARQPKTPAMAAGITTQVWSLRELLLFRVPPWHQPLLE